MQKLSFDVAEEPQTYCLITSLMDTTLFPALVLATEYHQRWERENTTEVLAYF